MLDYGYIKNHYRLIPVDLSRQKELDADPKAIKQIKLVGQSKKKKIDATGNVTDAGNNDYSCIKMLIIIICLLMEKKSSNLKLTKKC